MGKYLKNYIFFMEEQLDKDLAPEERESRKADLLIMIGFFQHERLIHLIVTVTFAFLDVAALFTSFFYTNIGLYLLILLFLILLIPYIRHYYILENGVQKLYRYYERLK